MEGGSIQINLRCIHGGLKSDYGFNSVLIIKHSKMHRPLNRVFKSKRLPKNCLKANTLSQVWETNCQGCGLIVVEIFKQKIFCYCHIVITLILLAE
jgi:hypothetical protein